MGGTCATPSSFPDHVMPWKVLTVVLAMLVMCGPAPAVPRRKPPPPVPELPGEQPFDEPPLSYADEWCASYVPNLVDIPATELVPRHHPTLEFSYVDRRFASDTFSNVLHGSQSGPRFTLHVRAGRDFQISAEAPYYALEGALRTGPLDNGGGAFYAFAPEIKYLVPYEVAGFRAALGARHMFSDDHNRPFFVPDDFERMQMVYASISRTPNPAFRWHLMAAYVPVPLPTGDHSLLAFGLEHQLFRFKDNFVRAIGELGKPHFTDTHLGSLGPLAKADNVYGNAALRVRSGILQVDVGMRRLMQPGYNEYFASVVKRF